MSKTEPIWRKPLHMLAVGALALYLGGAVAACSTGVGESAPPPASTEAPTPNYFHDIVHKASCWSIIGTGITCLPDSQLQ